MCTWSAGLKMSDPLLTALLQSIEQGQPVALVTVIRAAGPAAGWLGRRWLVWTERPPQSDSSTDLPAALLAEARRCLQEQRSQVVAGEIDGSPVNLFVEVQARPPTLIIVGAGHVALPLAQLGKMIDFDVVVLDDRPQFANAQRFPMADRVLAQPFEETLNRWPIDANTFIVLVTRGHTHDVACLLEVLDSPAAYIGMIGSKRRVRAVFELLEKERGLAPEKFSRVYSPIGLDIGAESPAEIAIAIIAEIINVYRGGRAVPLSDALRADRRLPLHPGRTG